MATDHSVPDGHGQPRERSGTRTFLIIWFGQLMSVTGSALIALPFWALLATGRLEVWHIYVGNALASALGAFQRPAYMALPSLLVPKEQFGRVGGLMQLAHAGASILAP